MDELTQDVLNSSILSNHERRWISTGFVSSIDILEPSCSTLYSVIYHVSTLGSTLYCDLTMLDASATLLAIRTVVDTIVISFKK